MIKLSKKTEIKPGDKYGKLTIIKELEPHTYPSGGKTRKVLCQCSCGSDPVEKLLKDLRNGKVVSCGCYHRERSSEVGKRNKKHNMFLIHVPSNTVIGFTRKMKKFYFDREYLPLVEKYCWHIYGGYVTAFDMEAEKTLKLHRLITNCPNDMVVDHINHNPLDNRKENLRICTQSDNCKNRITNNNKSSGVTGVSWVEKFSKWRARINIDGKRVSLGYFTNKEDAIAARHKAELKYYGEYSPNYEKLTQQSSTNESNQQPSEQQNT